MRSLSPCVAAGALCLPATYGLTRWGGWGSMIAALVVVSALGALGGAIAVTVAETGSQPRLSRLVAAFVGSAVLVEAITFLYYYLTYGHRDRYLIVGVVYSVLELGGIVAFGGAATWAGALLARMAARRPR